MAHCEHRLEGQGVNNGTATLPPFLSIIASSCRNRMVDRKQSYWDGLMNTFRQYTTMEPSAYTTRFTGIRTSTYSLTGSSSIFPSSMMTIMVMALRYSMSPVPMTMISSLPMDTSNSEPTVTGRLPLPLSASLLLGIIGQHHFITILS